MLFIIDLPQTGLSLRFRFAGYLLLVAGEVASSELISIGPQSSLERERKVCRRLFTSSIKRETRHFHVVVVL